MAKKRFLAGAKCPGCQTIDTLRITMYSLEENLPDRIECVQCGYTDQRPDEQAIKTLKNHDDDEISIVQLK